MHRARWPISFICAGQDKPVSSQILPDIKHETTQTGGEITQIVSDTCPGIRWSYYKEVLLKILCLNRTTNYVVCTNRTFLQMTHLQARLLCRKGVLEQENDVTIICASSKANKCTIK